MGVLIVLLVAYLFMVLILLVNFVMNFELWSNYYEFIIRNKKMTKIKFITYICARILAWPFFIKTLL